VSAEHDQHSAPEAHGIYSRVDDPEEIARDEDVGQAGQEVGERSAGRGQGSELLRADLVGPARDGNGPDLREIRFGLFRGAQGYLVGGRWLFK
jgi:hypothetical protein